MKPSILSAIIMLALAAPMVQADNIAEKGRKVFETRHEAVITVESIVSVSFGGESQEQEGWANATVISPDGLAVLALSALDPTTMAERMGTMSGEFSAQISSLRMRLSDGTDVNAEVALRDKELDLVYVRPVSPPESPLPYVNLADEGLPKLLDPVFAITQLGEVARRTHTILNARIEAIVERPRHYYIIGNDRSSDVICSPLFTIDGDLIGIGAFRAIRTGRGRQFGDNVLVVIVPVADIREGAAQAGVEIGDDGDDDEDDDGDEDDE